MSLAEVVATHRDLTKSVTIELDRSLLVKALHGQNSMAQRGIANLVVKAYNRAFREDVKYVRWEGLELEETAASLANQPECNCSCRSCDDNQFHCHNRDRGCEL